MSASGGWLGGAGGPAACTESADTGATSAVRIASLEAIGVAVPEPLIGIQ
jgi:hypothetical protein